MFTPQRVSAWNVARSCLSCQFSALKLHGSVNEPMIQRDNEVCQKPLVWCSLEAMNVVDSSFWINLTWTASPPHVELCINTKRDLIESSSTGGVMGSDFLGLNNGLTGHVFLIFKTLLSNISSALVFPFFLWLSYSKHHSLGRCHWAIFQSRQNNMSHCTDFLLLS